MNCKNMKKLFNLKVFVVWWFLPQTFYGSLVALLTSVFLSFAFDHWFFLILIVITGANVLVCSIGVFQENILKVVNTTLQIRQAVSLGSPKETIDISAITAVTGVINSVGNNFGQVQLGRGEVLQLEKKPIVEVPKLHYSKSTGKWILAGEEVTKADLIARRNANGANATKRGSANAQKSYEFYAKVVEIIERFEEQKRLKIDLEFSDFLTEQGIN